MEVFGDKKGCDDVGGVWGEVGVWWDFEETDGTQMTQIPLAIESSNRTDFRRFFLKRNKINLRKKTQIQTE
jgi:hypothetical protein